MASSFMLDFYDFLNIILRCTAEFIFKNFKKNFRPNT